MTRTKRFEIRKDLPKCLRVKIFWIAVFCKEPDENGYDFDLDEIFSMWYSPTLAEDKYFKRQERKIRLKKKKNEKSSKKH
jgi:hypothetical protein